MADFILRRQLLDFFQCHPQENIRLADICHAVRQPKKTVNSVLYKLKKEGVLEKVVESPPVWRLDFGFFEQHLGKSASFTSNNNDIVCDMSSLSLAPIPPTFEDNLERVLVPGRNLTALSISQPPGLLPTSVFHRAHPVPSSTDLGDRTTVSAEIQPHKELQTKNRTTWRTQRQSFRPFMNDKLSEAAIKILKVLQETKVPMTANDIANQIGYTESIVNMTLPQLVNCELVKQEGLEEPELWVATTTSSTSSVPPNGNKHIGGLVASIINYLKAAKTAVFTMDLVRAVGLESRKELNPILYRLEKEGILKKANDIPPMWQLSDLFFDSSMPEESPAILEPQTKQWISLNTSKSFNERIAYDTVDTSQNIHLMSHNIKEESSRDVAIISVSHVDKMTEAESLKSLDFIRKKANEDDNSDFSKKQDTMIKSLDKHLEEGKEVSQVENSDMEVKNSTTHDLMMYKNYHSQNSKVKEPAQENSLQAVPSSCNSVAPSVPHTAKSIPNVPVSSGSQSNVTSRHSQHEGSKKQKSTTSATSTAAATTTTTTAAAAAATSTTATATTTTSTTTNSSNSSSGAPEAKSVIHYVNNVLNSDSFAALMKNPVSALYEYGQRNHVITKVEIVLTEGPPHNPRFKAVAYMGSEELSEAWDKTKKDAKRQAAELAVRGLVAKGGFGKWSSLTPGVDSLNELSPVISQFDMIAALSHKTFNERVLQVPEYMGGRKVLAALVMKKGSADRGTVICLGTGNRCITGEGLSQDGLVVNDSHAEVITRRGFMRFLYKQLKTYKAGTEHPFLEPSADGRTLQIRPEITFHLYISTAPCGDGALFTHSIKPGEQIEPPDATDGKHHPVFTKSLQGLLRSKMEAGEGTIPIDTQYTFQSWDAILMGEKLRTMSCSDKIARWNVVGLQGALISHFVQPVYLSSVTLGNLYHHGHLSRAVCCRLLGEPDLNDLLPPGYHLNHPDLGRVSVCTPSRETEKTKPHSINWCIDDERPELTSGVTGTCDERVGGQTQSRLCKTALFQSFREICHQFNREDLLNKTYGKTKLSCRDFQNAKNVLFKRFQQLGRGTWIRKPAEEEEFM